jgi:DNA mismatch repair protein MSH3
MDVAKNEDSGHPLSPSVPKGNTSAPTPPHRQLRDGATSRYFSPSRISLLPDVSMGSSVLSPSAGPVRSQAASGNAACSPQTPQTCVNQTSLSPPSRFLSSSIDMVRSSGSRRHGRVPDHYSASRIGELSNDFCLGECVSPIPSLLDLKTPLEKEVMGFQNRFPDSTVAIECESWLRSSCRSLFPVIIFVHMSMLVGGYRLRFFGRCAEVASQVLGVLVNRRPGRVPSASVPTHRVVVHLRRLLEAGQKVGSHSMNIRLCV